MLKDIRKNHIDVVIIVCVLIFALSSLLAVFSATFATESVIWNSIFSKQLLWVIVGLFIGAAITFIPPAWIANSSYKLYFILITLLFLTYFLGSGAGSRRWLNLLGFHVQASEFMKPVLVMVLARFLAKDYRTPDRPDVLFAVSMLVFLPFILVLQQPDLGTSLVYLIVLLPVLYWRGLSLFVIFVLCSPIITFFASFNFWTFFIVILLISAILYLSRRGPAFFTAIFLLNITIGIIAPIAWNSLHAYQKQRILTFLGLSSDPQGVGYQIIQSKVAIGSGGLLGKGLLQGTQTQLRFLPAQHTDFIFSVIAEELGFIGAILLLAVFMIFLIRGIYIASTTKDQFAALLTFGLVTIFAFQVVVNIGMTVGIMPVTGIPLPFISYGGSSMLTCMIMAGLIANTSLHRYKLY
jgi:rod shape determining protein RodA